MTDENLFTVAEAHRHFAITLNGRTWELLEKAARSEDEDQMMLHAAHASCYHWLQVGSGVNQQRGEWLIARVYTTLDRPEAALQHAKRCLALTEQYAGEMRDFDRAFAFESVARANAIAGNKDQALKYFRLAEKAGSAISDDEDREIFQQDFDGGDWRGLR